MTACPRAGCGRVGTEIVNGVAFCARDAADERRAIEGRPRRPDPLGLSAARQVLTKIIRMPRANAIEYGTDKIHITFNDLGEPTELRIGPHRYRVFPRGWEP